MALLVEDIHDWAYVVLNPGQVVYPTRIQDMDTNNLFNAAMSVAAKAAAAKVLYRLFVIVESPRQCGLNRKILHRIAHDTVTGGSGNHAALARELVDIFFNLYLNSAWDTSLSRQSFNDLGYAEAIRWSLRNSSHTHLWAPGAYPANRLEYLRDAFQHLQKAILSDSVAPPTIASVEIASKIDIKQIVSDNPKHIERIIQIGSRSPKDVGRYLSHVLLTILDENLINTVTPSVVNSLLQMYIDGHNEADLNKMWGIFAHMVVHSTSKETKPVPAFIKACVVAMKSKPEVFSVDGGRLLNRLFEMSKFSDRNIWHQHPFPLGEGGEEPWAAYTGAHLSRHLDPFILREINRIHENENKYITTFLRQIPMLLNRGNSRTLCEHFKAMESIPAEVRSRILGAMMHSPKSYGINAKESKLLSILAHDLTNGDAHAEHTDRGCEIVTGDGMRILLTNSTESGGER